MSACVRCGDAIDRDGGALLQYCSFCVRLERPYNWGDETPANDVCGNAVTEWDA